MGIFPLVSFFIDVSWSNDITAHLYGHGYRHLFLLLHLYIRAGYPHLGPSWLILKFEGFLVLTKFKGIFSLKPSNKNGKISVKAI